MVCGLGKCRRGGQELIGIKLLAKLIIAQETNSKNLVQLAIAGYQ